MRESGEGEKAAGEALWRFSLALYARPGVAAALLALQDRAGLDVNLILCAAWAGATRRERLDAAGLAALVAAAAPLNGALVAPLRGLRHQLKAAGDREIQALRRRVLALELTAERAVQRRLAAALAGDGRTAPGRNGVAAAAANLALCLGGEAASPEAATLRRALSALCRRV